MLIKYLKFSFFAVGIILLGFILAKTDLTQLLEQLSKVGLGGLVVILLIYSLYFAADSLSWQITVHTIPLNFRWIMRFYAVRMVGEAYNNITPVASMGGEPLKAWLLKSNWGVSLTESGVALVISKTTSMFTLVLFVALGVVNCFYHPNFTYEEKEIAGLGFFLIVFFAFIFFLMQRLKLLSSLAQLLEHRFYKFKLQRFVEIAETIDRKFENFYSSHKLRLFQSAVFAMLNWIFGVIEIYFIFLFLGDPLTFGEAWMLESIIQLVRTITFFVPAGIGTQEGAFFIGAGMITGFSSLGVAAALVRRARDIFWIALSLSILSFFSVKPSSKNHRHGSDG